MYYINIVKNLKIKSSVYIVSVVLSQIYFLFLYDFFILWSDKKKWNQNKWVAYFTSMAFTLNQLVYLVLLKYLILRNKVFCLHLFNLQQVSELLDFQQNYSSLYLWVSNFSKIYLHWYYSDIQSASWCLTRIVFLKIKSNSISWESVLWL